MKQYPTSSDATADPVSLVLAVIDAFDDAVAILGAGGEVIVANGACHRLLGVDPSTGESFEDVLARSRIEGRANAKAHFLASMKTNGQPPKLFSAEDSEGNRIWVELDVRRTHFPGYDWQCVVRDVTQQHQQQVYRFLSEVGRLGAERTRTADLAERLVERLQEALDVDAVVLALREGASLRPVAWRGLFLAGDPIRAEAFPQLQRAIDRREVIASDGAEWGGLSEGGVCHIVPLTFSGDVMGTLHLGTIESSRRTPNRVELTPERLEYDLELLEALGTYVGAVVASVRLVEDSVQSHARLSALVEEIPDGIVLYDARGKVLVSNSAAHRIAEFEWTDLNRDKRPYRLRSEEGKVLPRSEWPFFKAANSGREVLDQTVVLDFGEYERRLNVTVVPVPSIEPGGISTFVATLQDVTERSLIEQRKDEFISVASHELRSPLTPLMGFVQMLRRQVAAGDPADPALLVRAERQVHRLSRLVESLLDVSRIETGQLQLDTRRVDLRDVVLRVVDACRDAHPEAQLVVEVPGAPVWAVVDEGRIDQAITNLAENAFKHAPSTSEVVVVLDATDTGILLEVRDHGEGMTPDELSRVFERFYSKTAGRAGAGLGLGLYITREIVRRHGGSISIDSALGNGTTVTIELPLDLH